MIVYFRARLQSYWLTTTRKPKVLHLLQGTLRHKKASSMNALRFTIRQLLIHHEMAEPTHMTSAEKRAVNETAKELRASLPITTSSHVSSLRLDDETHEQLTRSVKQTRTTKAEFETLQDVSFQFQKGHCDHQRNGFLQVRMVGMRQSNNKKQLKKKDGERNLHFASCPPEVQAVLRGTRRAEWKKWLNFDAGVILTDEEVRQLTEAGCEIYPMQWIEMKPHICEGVKMVVTNDAFFQRLGLEPPRVRWMGDQVRATTL